MLYQVIPSAITIAVGNSALQLNTTGGVNTAVGVNALQANTGGYINTAVGESALVKNTTGGLNTAIGHNAAGFNLTGNGNTAVGQDALNLNTTGDFNTAIGHSASFTIGTLFNTSTMGYDAGGVVNASNRIEIGNTFVSFIGGQVGWSTYSDARIKDNVIADVPGLDFITKLKPVTYNLNVHRQNEMVFKGSTPEWDSKYDIEKIKMTGFLAQDVEAAAIASGYEFSGIQKPANPNELYSLRYSDFVMPLVKAVQEQQVIIENQNETIEFLKEQNQDMQLELAAIKKKLGM